MKTWERAEVIELEISETKYDWWGNNRDGGYIGDGIISGHLEWNCKPKPTHCPTPSPIPTPVIPPSDDDTDNLS